MAATPLISHRKYTGKIFGFWSFLYFIMGKGGGWRCQFTGVPGLNLFHGSSVNMIFWYIPLIENFSMTSHRLLLGYWRIFTFLIPHCWWPYRGWETYPVCHLRFNPYFVRMMLKTQMLLSIVTVSGLNKERNLKCNGNLKCKVKVNCNGNLL